MAKKQALIVDDARVIRMLLGKILTGAGYETHEAADGRQALVVLGRTGPLDVALIDWNMPEMNGYDLVCTLREDPTFRDMRLVMVTTETERSRVRRALLAGADEYVMKPFTEATILEKLELAGA